MARIVPVADRRCSWLRGRRLRHPSSVAMGADVVLLACGRRAVQMARLLAAQTEGSEWSLCARTDGFAGFDEPLCPRYRSVDSDLEIVVVDRSPGSERRMACHANVLGPLSAVVDVRLPYVRQGRWDHEPTRWHRVLTLEGLNLPGTLPRADDLLRALHFRSPRFALVARCGWLGGFSGGENLPTTDETEQVYRRPDPGDRQGARSRITGRE